MDDQYTELEEPVRWLEGIESFGGPTSINKFFTKFFTQARGDDT